MGPRRPHHSQTSALSLRPQIVHDPPPDWMRTMSLENLRERIAAYTALDAPTGFEEPVLRQARTDLAKCCERVEVDVRGNVYGYQPGRDPQAPRIMVTAHADEIGFMVTSLLPDGFLRFTKLGHPTDMVLPGQRVRLLTTRGPL